MRKQRSQLPSFVAATLLCALLAGCLALARSTGRDLEQPAARGLRALSDGLSAVDSGRVPSAVSRLTNAAEELRPVSASWGALAEARLGDVLGNSGRLLEAEAAVERSHELLTEAGEITPQTICVLDRYANLERVRSRFASAERYEREALAARRRFGIGGEPLVDTLENLARAVGMAGGLRESERLLFQVIDERREWRPESLELAGTMHRLGVLLWTRGELERARYVTLEGLSIAEKIDREALVVSRLYGLLSTVARDLGEFEQAIEYAERRWSIRGVRGPVDRTQQLHELGAIEISRGDFDAAVQMYVEVVAMLDEIDPSGRRMQRGLYRLGSAQRRQGASEIAEETLRRSLAGLTVGDRLHSLALYELARSLWEQGRLKEADEVFAVMLDALETEVERLGGTLDAREEFRSDRIAFYEDAMELRLERGRVEGAFLTIERSRARTLLTLLAARRRGFGASALQERYRELADRYNRVQSTIREEGPQESLLRRRRFLEQSRQEVSEQLRRSTASLAGRRSEMLDSYAAIQRALPLRALGLYFVATAENTWLFLLEDGRPLEVIELGLNESDLAALVDPFVALARASGAPGRAGEMRHRAFEVQARSLYERLFGRLDPTRTRDRPWVIFPDGPLHRLPFAALQRPALGDEGGYEYALEASPIHVAPSATLYRELGARPDAGRTSLVAFGVSEGARSVGIHGRELVPLPHSRREVEQISKLYRDAVVLLDADASEEAGRSASVQQASVLHFAGHTVLDPEYPLDSGLLLADEAGAPTLLQAWEIMEQLQLRADVVVLSSCSSALGSPRAGDGLVGLTSAFQSVGARSVVASLWSVSDRATAELMTRFHRYRASGMSSGDALRAAQLEVARGLGGEGVDAGTSPYHWAAFQLFGYPI